MGSIVVSVRDDLTTALKTEIQGTAGMEDVYVEFQHPVGDVEPREAVWTQDAQINLSNASLRAGKNFSNEETTFSLLFKSWRPNTTAQEAAQRVADIAEVASDWIANHKNGEGLPTAHSLGLNWITVSGSGAAMETLDNDSITGRFQIPITYAARLT